MVKRSYIFSVKHLNLPPKSLETRYLEILLDKMIQLHIGLMKEVFL